MLLLLLVADGSGALTRRMTEKRLVSGGTLVAKLVFKNYIYPSVSETKAASRGLDAVCPVRGIEICGASGMITQTFAIERWITN